MPPGPALEVTRVTKRYGDRLALDDVSLRVRPGEVHGLLGPNGAGKTTLLRLAFGLLHPDSGSVRLGGLSHDEHGVAALRAVGGYVEGPRFYPYLSGEQNLSLLAHLDGARGQEHVRDALVGAGLAGRGEDKVGVYSLGMRQRLGLAAALLRDPELLILDEPSNGLDPAGAARMRARIAGLAGEGRAVLLSSHVMHEVEELCDGVTVLSAGRVAFTGSPAELRARLPRAPLLLRTGDDEAALRLAAPGSADLDVAAGPDGGLLLRGEEDAVDGFVLRLARTGIAVRGLAPTGSGLQDAFVSVTNQPPGSPAPPDTSAAPDTPAAPDTYPAPAATGPAYGKARPFLPGAVRVLRVEVCKLAAQARTRVAVAVCVLGPLLFGLALRAAGTTPRDSLFGRYVHESGLALDLVVLGFAGQWLFPVLVALVAGDEFAGEDSGGTWNMLLTRSVSRGQVVAGKTAAAVGWAALVLVLLAGSTAAAGLLTVGDRSLVSLSGQVLPPGRGLALVALAWASSLPALLGWTGVALALSAVLRRPGAAVLATVVLGAVVQLLTLLPLAPPVQRALLSAPSAAWHGLFTAPRFLGPLWQGLAVSLVWAVSGVVLSAVVVQAREFRGQ